MDELETLWQSVLSEMEIQLSHANFHTWMKNSKLVNRQDGGTFTIALPNNFCKEWVENKYHMNILSVLRNLDNSAKKVDFIVHGSMFKANYVPGSDKRSRPTAASQMVFPEFKINPDTNLNPKYKFSNFIVGSSNELAFAAAQAVVKTIGTKYNPLFIYGGVGLGKTHLMQSIGNEINSIYGVGKVNIKYVSSEKFTSDVVWAIRNKRMDDIKKRYRDTDVLIIDDIQFIGGKEKTEEEFFHTFNALHSLNKQIIISSDRPPGSLPTLHERLRSRFEGGMTIDVVYPDYEMRIAIIKTKLEECQHELSEVVIDLIAKKLTKNIREIEGILNKIIFIKESKGIEIDESVVEDIINKNIQNNKNISPNKIIKSVADFFEISIIDLMGKSRKKEIVEPRQITMYLLRDMLSMSYPYIGDKVGKRDHTTAIHACEKINREVVKNINLGQKVGLIKESILKE